MSHRFIRKKYNIICRLKSKVVTSLYLTEMSSFVMLKPAGETFTLVIIKVNH